MLNFDSEYNKLNSNQKRAVDYIDGPMLILAGPGTGKTQLLGARVANILKKTDTAPNNILCLTFTESGALTMRERLVRFIGLDAYDVNISTYHALGADLIRRFPEYFTQTRLENPVDELSKREIVSDIVARMSYSNPLKPTEHYLSDLISTISEIKRGLLDETSLKLLASENARFIDSVNGQLVDLFLDFKVMPRKLNVALELFKKTQDTIDSIPIAKKNIEKYLNLKTIMLGELEKALNDAEQTNKTTPLTSWKNTWLEKNSSNQFIMSGRLQNNRIDAIADVFKQYQAKLEERGLYDFDDMILRTIKTLQANPNLKYTLQEQYLYILLDEFQDTNSAQFQLVKLLSDNPVNEGRPNVMAVGDDDQAIYAFQGAHYSNMIDFYDQYKNVEIVSLDENYRSHNDILKTAKNIVEQIDSRLQHTFTNVTKDLISANKNLPRSAEIQRREFKSDVAELSWIAEDISKKIKKGVTPKEIAVLSTRHKYLEPLVAYLNNLKIPVKYEKRENILDREVVKAIIIISRLCQALFNQNHKLIDTLWPQALSFDFLEIPVETIWQTSWKVSDSKGSLSWTNAILQNNKMRPIALLFLAISNKINSVPAENLIDYITGIEPIETGDNKYGPVKSPMKEFYTNDKVQSNNPQIFYEVLSSLSIMRSKLREHQATKNRTMMLGDFLSFIDLYEDSEARMLDSSPYSQSSNSVQLMTVFKAKGQEFEYVYMPACVDNVWGESSKSNTNKLSLPPNLAPIRHVGSSQDEKLRIFFVAITRAKIGLLLTSFQYNYSGKPTKKLKYLNEQSEDGINFKTMSLPDKYNQNAISDTVEPKLETLISNWQNRHTLASSQVNLKSLLVQRLENYQLSPTHLNSFFDLMYGGPQIFFFNTILRFPSAPTINGQYGNAIHEALQWSQNYLNINRKLPKLSNINEYYSKCIKKKMLDITETSLLIERGEKALNEYFNQRSNGYKIGSIAEHNFRGEGVFVGDAHLSGKIDLLEIDKIKKTITIVDYKTGASFNKWATSPKLHKYKQQLYIYKLLVEGSHSYKDYEVIGGRLEFIEPDSNGKINSLVLDYQDAELENIIKLIKGMWPIVKTLNFPDVSSYEKTPAGSKKFEQDFLKD